MSYDDDKPFSFPSPDKFTHHRYDDRKFSKVRIDRIDFPFRYFLSEYTSIRGIPDRRHLLDRPIHKLRFKIRLVERLDFIKRLRTDRVFFHRYTVGKRRTLPFN